MTTQILRIDGLAPTPVEREYFVRTAISAQRQGSETFVNWARTQVFRTNPAQADDKGQAEIELSLPFLARVARCMLSLGS